MNNEASRSTRIIELKMKSKRNAILFHYEDRECGAIKIKIKIKYVL